MCGNRLRLPALVLLVVLGLASMGSLSLSTPASTPAEAGGGFFVTIIGQQAASLFVMPYTEVPAGSIVRFQNRGDVAHNAVADDGSFNTGLFGPGESSEVVVVGSGIVTYHCSKHPDTMLAALNVV